PIVDVVSNRQPSAADCTGFAAAVVHQQLVLETARAAGGSAVVAEGGSLGGARRGQNRADCTAPGVELLHRYLVGRLGRIDPGDEQGLVGVDVPDADDEALVHQHLLDGSA